MTATTGPDRSPRSARRRVLTPDEDTPRFFVSDLDGAPRWVGGLLAGLQGALLSLLVVVLPAVAAYVVTSADPTNSGIAWTRSAAVGAGLWLLGHGVPMTTGDQLVSLVPLGLTALSLFACYASARRSGYATRSALAAGVCGYVGTVLVVALLVGASPLQLVLALLGGTLVSVVGLGTGLARRAEAPDVRRVTAPLWSRIPAPVRVGATAGLLAVALLVLVASLVVVMWVLSGRDTVVEVIRSLDVDLVGGSVLALGELAFVPNLVLWALAWVAGPGFEVGAGTTFTASEVVAGPIPAVPLLGALPQPGAAGGPLALLPVLVVVLGAAAGWWLHRRLRTERWTQPLVAVASAAVSAGLVTAVAMVASGGAIGPGRMQQVGAAALPVAGAVALAVLVGTVLVVLPWDASLRAAIAGWWRRTVLARPSTRDAPES
ncbi:hypothetical protein AGMMS50218_01680 [Actinomycetota bacterium]|nr:hypothetical protein AGMMS50218_01680 [Actinomycetota bacterium]